MVLIRCPNCSTPSRIAHVELVYYKDVDGSTKIVNFECMKCDKVIAAHVEIDIGEPIENEDWVDYSRLSEYLKKIDDHDSSDAHA